MNGWNLSGSAPSEFFDLGNCISDGAEVTGNTPLPATFAGFFASFLGSKVGQIKKEDHLVPSTVQGGGTTSLEDFIVVSAVLCPLVIVP